MNGVGGRPPVIPAVVARQREARRQAELDRDIRDRQRALAAMNPHQRAVFDVAEMRRLATVADAKAAEATDPEHRAELEKTAADLRREAKKLEAHMPVAIDTATVDQIRSEYTAKATEIHSQLADLAKDDGRESGYKNRRRHELLDALDTARQAADRELAAWAQKAEAAAKKELSRDTRDGPAIQRSVGVELMSSRLARSVGTTAEAEHRLMDPARQLAADGRNLEALAHARAAAEHGVFGAEQLAAQLEREDRDSWPGQEEARQALADVALQVRDHNISTRVDTAKAERAAAQIAHLTGDSAANNEHSMAQARAEIVAKLAVNAAAVQDGKPYVDPTA